MSVLRTKFSQAEGKTGGSAISRAPLPPTRKHLIDCNVVILSKDSTPSASFFAERVSRWLTPASRSVHMHYGGGSAPIDVERTDIVIFMFYRHFETAVHRLIADFRRSNPNVYAVILSATPNDVEAGKADLVLDKGQIGDSLPVQLRDMLCNDPLGAKS